MHYNEFDERRNKNTFCDYDEIDERQSLELLSILDRWEKGELEPQDAILEVTYTVGAHVHFLISYRVSKECDLGTEKHQQAIHSIHQCMRPEILDLEKSEAIAQAVEDVRTRIESAEFDSWDAARALAEIFLKPTSGEKHIDPLSDFTKEIEEEKADCLKRKKDFGNTADLLKPETEAEIKRPIAIQFAGNRAYEEWRNAEIKAYEVETGQEADPEGRQFRRYHFNNYVLGHENIIPENPEFIPPIHYPNRKLCAELQIAPSGTGLIEPYERSSFEDGVQELYGRHVARITTYSVSFVPKNPEDTELLREIILSALKILSTIPYPYSLPGDYTPSGTGYSRIYDHETPYSIHYHDASERPYVRIDDDGKLTPSARFDLDDLWILYFLLEPVIEPNEQIAQAMNSALYAEERGGIMKPDEVNYADIGHDIDDPLGSLQKEDPTEMLADVLRNAFIDLSLNKIDEAEFLMRVMTLADHTLTGRMSDLSGNFPAFSELIEDQNAQNGEVIVYDRVLKDRTQEMIRILLGLDSHSDVSLSQALSSAKKAASEPLREHFREKARHDHIEVWQKIREKYSEHRSLTGIYESLFDRLGKHERALKHTDMLTGNFGKEKERNETAVAKTANLVVSDSAVETYIDGIHRDRDGDIVYITKTKGSIYVRKELPEALKPFLPKSAARPAVQTLLGSPENILG